MNHWVHTRSIRIAGGPEILVTRVTAGDGKVGYGFSLREDATESRHMAEWQAGLRERPQHSPEIPAELAAAIAAIAWESPPAPPPASSAPTR